MQILVFYQETVRIACKAAENKKKSMVIRIVLSVQNTKNARERAYKVQKLLADTGLSSACNSSDANC